ncbi:MAG: ABC transporter ATP-binding protein [Spirochaetaceae bacterium]|nr:MAG: ABC transporter ATP-binding protein [Spirochaetaceae bacterium]
MSTEVAAVEMLGVTKAFGDFLAVDAVDLQLHRGEVLAILGENGAGKSTLMNLLYGLYRPSSGTIIRNGEPIELDGPLAAIEQGIAMVHQHFMLVNALNVLENVAIGQSRRRIGLGLRQIRERLHELCERHGMPIDLDAPVSSLPVGVQQRVEIIKALYHGADVLILDEPTGVLTPQETQALIRVVREMAAAGTSVVFISHKLSEVMQVSDRIVIMRRGKLVGTTTPAQTTVQDLAEMMVGRSVQVNRTNDSGSDRIKLHRSPALNFYRVTAHEARGLPFGPVSCSVQPGEILGVAGVDGNGQSTLAELAVGIRDISGGEIYVNGNRMAGKGPLGFLNARVSCVPEDRHRVGSVAGFELWESVAMKNHFGSPYNEFGFMRRDRLLTLTEGLIMQFDIRTTGATAQAQSLSGGNLQKLIIARELDRAPRALVAMHPTRGLDVGAVEFVQSSIRSARDNGAGVLLISAELEELFSLSDRIIVMYQGKIAGELQSHEYNANRVGLLMSGIRPDGEPNSLRPSMAS